MPLTKLEKQELERHFWRVSTQDTITQNAIAEELARQGEGYGSETNIFYAGKEIPVFIVNFDIIFYLTKNKDKVPYSFTAYHRKDRSGGWHAWRQGKKTPIQKLLHEFPITSEKIKGEALKKKKRDNLLKKIKTKREISMKKTASRV
ncbi:MAG: hypothetical protein KBC41_04110 [Candidatus Pacebacteria bacterium]|nr:hypothetical protein [Candidatus Paceibacterota bacterium]MBP9867227.1 hypothetical protein [Candidatus Paceibacterota bacterium]